MGLKKGDTFSFVDRQTGEIRTATLKVDPLPPLPIDPERWARLVAIGQGLARIKAKHEERKRLTGTTTCKGPALYTYERQAP